MEGIARRVILVLAALTALSAALTVSRPVTEARQSHSTACVFDHLSLRTARGTCRPRARSYPPNVRGSVKRAVYDASLTFGMPYSVLLAIARCESDLNPHAAYEGHYGLYQFLPQTFSRAAGELRADTGITAHSYWNPLDAGYVAGFMFVTGKALSWSCETIPGG
jgi:hypothetical protein